MSVSVYGFATGPRGYNIIDSVIMPYWMPALRDLGKRVEHPWQNGYKLHVTARPSDVEKVAKAVLPLLQQSNLDHKVVYPQSAYEEMCRGDQAGKFITIYPGPVLEGYTRLLGQLDPLLNKLKQGGTMPGPIPKDRQKGHAVSELKSGTSGFLWYITTESYFK